MPDKPLALSTRINRKNPALIQHRDLIEWEQLARELEKDRARLRKELIYAVMSLHSYEQSCGTGCGSDEAREIAMQFGFEGGSDHDLTGFLIAAMAAEEGR